MTREARTANTGFASNGVTLKLEALYFYSSSVLIDFFVLRHPIERKARKRYWKLNLNHMKNKLSSLWHSLFANFTASPIQLQSFFVFCALVTVLGYLIQPFLSDNINGIIIPITGWNMAIPYSFNLIVMGSFFINPKSTNRKLNIQYSNILMLAIPIVFGLFDLLTWRGGYEGNPYLFRSPWRPVWTIAIPIVWIVVMLSPRIKKYLIPVQSSES